jgi:hypothetical protein
VADQFSSGPVHTVTTITTSGLLTDRDAGAAREVFKFMDTRLAV